MNQSYDELLTWAYLGEVWGQAMTQRLIRDDTFPAERDHLRLLHALESRTRDTLETIVSARALAVDVRDTQREADEYAQAYARKPEWDALMRETQQIATTVLPDFEKLCQLGPQDDAEALEEALEHERAVLEYATARLEGRRGDAADAVHAHLRSCGLLSS